MADELKITVSGLIALSEAAAQQVCRPLAERVASGLDDAHVEYVPRSGIDEWARFRATTEAPGQIAKEIRTGAMARLLGGL